VSAITISPLREEDIPTVAKLHAAELQYSFNSRLGPQHLASVYRAMAKIPDCYIGVALDNNVPVGVVSGAVNVKKVKPAVLRSLGLQGYLRLAGRLLITPSAFAALLSESKSRPPVIAEGKEIDACLTAIAVAASHRRKGLASQLVTALEDFFRARGVSHYWLDTVLENTGARSFYQSIGFTEVMEVGKTVVLLKRLK
jgi:ribosomal protein S18 acetylase RimI-like enzyme